MRKLFVLLLVLLPILACATVPAASANYTKPGHYDSIFQLPYDHGQPTELAVFAGPAILVCIALAVLAYMAGEALDMPTIKAYAKGEVLELGNTIVIFVFILAALFVFSLAAQRLYPNIVYTTAGGGVTPSGVCGYYATDPLNPSHTPTMFSMADYFLGCQPYWDKDKTGYGVLLPKLIEMYTSLMQLEALLGILSTLGAQVNLPSTALMQPSLSVAFHAGLTVVSDAHTLIVDAIGMTIVTVIGQKVLLEFIYTSVLRYFLPLGIFLRALPFTRKTGSTVIAVCVVFYFVYPSSIMINKYIFDTYVTLPTDEGAPYGGLSKRTDFVNYANAIEICTADPGSDMNTTIANWWQGAWSGMEEYKDRVYFTPSEDVNISAYQSLNRTDYKLRFLKTLMSTVNTVTNLNKIGGAFALFVPYAPLLGAYFYDAITHELTVATQFLTLYFIFIVLSIIFTLTLFKDISLAIGGETRVFGITKLV